MKLKKIIRDTGAIQVWGSDEAEISGLAFDSRDVQKGNLFFAVSGTVSDGHDYIGMAVDKGAAAIVCERMPEAPVPGITYIQVSDSAQALGEMASAYYDNPSPHL
mgnify:CR=1 FL=1